MVSGSLWNVRVRPVPLPASALCGHGAPRLAPCSGLYIVQWRPGQGSGQEPGLAGRQGWGLRPPSQERPASSGGPPAQPEPFSGCGLEGCPRGHKPCGAPSTLPLLTQVPACAGGSDAEITVRTPESMHICFCFSGKKSPFPVFYLFVFLFFKDFSFSSNFLDLAHGEPSKRDSVS